MGPGTARAVASVRSENSSFASNRLHVPAAARRRDRVSWTGEPRSEGNGRMRHHAPSPRPRRAHPVPPGAEGNQPSPATPVPLHRTLLRWCAFTATRLILVQRVSRRKRPPPNRAALARDQAGGSPSTGPGSPLRRRRPWPAAVPRRPRARLPLEIDRFELRAICRLQSTNVRLGEDPPPWATGDSRISTKPEQRPSLFRDTPGFMDETSGISGQQMTLQRPEGHQILSRREHADRGAARPASPEERVVVRDARRD